MNKMPDYSKFWSPAFDVMDDFVFLIDLDFTIVAVNESFLRSQKKERGDIVGRKCYEIVHTRSEPIAECPNKRSLETKRAQSEEFYDANIKKWLHVTTVPIFDEHKNLLGTIHIATDITERREADEELNKKIADLERFQRITVDRELKMKELKSRIAELESKLDKKND